MWSGYLDATTTGTWGITGDQFNTPATVANCGLNGPGCTFAQVKTLLGDAGATIYTAAVTKGRDAAFQGAVDGLTINGSVYDFEPFGVNITTAPLMRSSVVLRQSVAARPTATPIDQAPPGRLRRTARLSTVQTRTLMKQVLAQGDRVLKPDPGVTVLIYHRVGGGSTSEVDLDVDAFRAQLEHLRDHHTVVSLDDAVTLLAEPGTTTATTAGPNADPTERTVVITFDDGTADFCDHAVPALVEFDLPATLYVATHFIDSGEPFPWGAPPATWAGLRDAATTGLVTIGSHTHTHALLDRVADAGGSTIGDELDRSIELIGEHIGTTPAHFAYPKALPGSDAAEAEVRRRFSPPRSPGVGSINPAVPTSTASGAPPSNAATARTSLSPKQRAAYGSKVNSATSSPGSSTAAPPPEVTMASPLDEVAAAAAWSLPGGPRVAIRPDDPDRFVGVVADQRVSGLVIAAATAGALEPSDPTLLERLHATHLDALRTSLAVEAASVEVSTLLAHAGIRHAILKGCATARLDYADPSLRMTGDVDVLIDRSSYTAAFGRLRNAGIHRLAPPFRTGWEQRYGKDIALSGNAQIEIDLHLGLVGGYFGVVSDTGLLLDDLVDYEVADHRLPALDAVGRIVHAAIHSAGGPTIRLGSAADIIVLAQTDAVTRDRVVARSRPTGLRGTGGCGHRTCGTHVPCRPRCARPVGHRNATDHRRSRRTRRAHAPRRRRCLALGCAPPAVDPPARLPRCAPRAVARSPACTWPDAARPSAPLRTSIDRSLSREQHNRSDATGSDTIGSATTGVAGCHRLGSPRCGYSSPVPQGSSAPTSATAWSAEATTSSASTTCRQEPSTTSSTSTSVS